MAKKRQFQKLKHQADSIKTHNEKVDKLAETARHNKEVEAEKQLQLVETERKNREGEVLKGLLVEVAQARADTYGLSVAEKERTDRQIEGIRQQLADIAGRRAGTYEESVQERERANKIIEGIRKQLADIAGQRATTYEKSTVEKSRHDRAMEGIKGLKGSGGSPRSATNERFTNNVIRSVSEGLRAINQLKSLDSKTGGGYFGTVVGKGDITSSAAAALAVNVSSEREKMYNATISGLSLEVAMAMSGGYKPDVGLQRSLQETHRVTEEDTELTAAYKVADVISKLKASLTVTPSYTKEQKQNKEDLLKMTDQYDSPENVIQKFNSANTPRGTSAAKPKPANAPADAKLANDGHYYSPDPARPGKYLDWGK